MAACRPFAACRTGWRRWRGPGSVVWVNDSKATNPDSAEKSLTSFANIFWIAGGKPKPGGFRSLRPALRATFVPAT